MREAKVRPGREWPSARALAASGGLLVAGGLACEVSSRIIGAWFSDAPVVPDLLFVFVPYVREVLWVSTGAMVLGVLLFAYYSLRYARDQLPTYLAVLGLMYLLRAVLMVLTPLAHARGEGPIQMFPLFQNGMWPSGHTAAALLFAWMTDARRAPGLRTVQVVLAVVVIVALIVSRGHYSIDIVGGVLLAYFVEREWRLGKLFGPVKRLVYGEVRDAAD